MNQKPNIVEVKCTRLQFQPGDRVLVRVFSDVTPDQKKRIRDTVCKWAGCDIEVFVYNAFRMEISVEQKKPPLISD